MVSLKERYENQVDYLAEIIKDVPDCDYEVKFLHDVLKMAVSVDQTEIPEEIIECKRVIKIKRMIPIEDLRLSHPELLVNNGVYLISDGIAIPEKYFDEMGISGRFIIPDQSKLPYGYNYGTLRYAHKYAFALKESSLTKYITNSSGWEFFDLNCEE